MAIKVSHRPRKKPLLIGLGLLIIACIVFTGLELTNTTYIFHKKKVPATIPVKTSSSSSLQSKKSSSPTSSSGTAQQSTQSTKVQSSSGGNSSSNIALMQPYGDLVSNHFPGQNGSNTQEQSTCNTTPGATCYIQLTNTEAGKTTKLPSQTVGSDGSTAWTWDANTLTSGQWQIMAVASLNGQTKSVTDSIKLSIQ